MEAAPGSIHDRHPVLCCGCCSVSPPFCAASFEGALTCWKCAEDGTRLVLTALISRSQYNSISTLLQANPTQTGMNGLLVWSTLRKLMALPPWWLCLIIIISFRPYISASLLGCWLTDPFNNVVGRRGTIFIAGIFCTLTVIGSGLAQTWPQLFVRHYFPFFY